MKKYTDTGKIDTRSGFGEGLLLAGRENDKVLALTADLKGSLKMGAFAKEFHAFKSSVQLKAGKYSTKNGSTLKLVGKKTGKGLAQTGKIV